MHTYRHDSSISISFILSLFVAITISGCHRDNRDGQLKQLKEALKEEIRIEMKAEEEKKQRETTAKAEQEQKDREAAAEAKRVQRELLVNKRLSSVSGITIGSTGTELQSALGKPDRETAFVGSRGTWHHAWYYDMGGKTYRVYNLTDMKITSINFEEK